MFRRFCKMFSESTQAVGPYCSCHAAQGSKGNFQKTCWETFRTSGRPTQYALLRSTCPNEQVAESELICTTSYVELFLRRISEPSLLAVFLRFLFTETCDDKNIVDQVGLGIKKSVAVSKLNWEVHIQSGVSHLSQGFEDNVLGSSPG